jgi:hypothetical protein
MRLASERAGVGIGRIARILPPLVRIRPFRRVGLAHRRVQGVMRVGVLGVVARVAARRLGKSGGGLVRALF